MENTLQSECNLILAKALQIAAKSFTTSKLLYWDFKINIAFDFFIFFVNKILTSQLMKICHSLWQNKDIAPGFPQIVLWGVTHSCWTFHLLALSWVVCNQSACSDISYSVSKMLSGEGKRVKKWEAREQLIFIYELKWMKKCVSNQQTLNTSSQKCYVHRKM